MKKKKKKESTIGHYILLFSLCAVLGVAVVWGFVGSNASQFAKGRVINGIDVGGMTPEQATYAINNKIVSENEDASITFVYDDFKWDYGRENLTLAHNTEQVVNKSLSKSIFSRLTSRGAKSDVEVSYSLKNTDNIVEEIVSQIEQPVKDATIDFNPQTKEFTITPEQVGREVDRAKLMQQMISTFLTKNVTIEVPVIETQPVLKAADLARCKTKQATFSTTYSKSTAERKENIAVASSKLNGLKVEPGEEKSFNEIVGERTASNGFKEANIIKDGNFVKGVGGGVCQVSTTLYNALLLSGVEITEVNKHSLPVSYVPLAFDAMVSWGYSDLKFKNDSNLPMFICANADGTTITCEIYGALKEPNEDIQTRAEFIGTIPHGGDTIVADENGEYSDKIVFKGEYLRVKYPQEGYESKAYLRYFKDGEFVGEELVRHEKYLPHNGVVYEGTEDLPEGMTLPNNSANIIPPQTTVSSDSEQATENINIKNPTIYNP